jgi:alpha-tubulin suppressor-like RCC1 family protein
VRLVVPARSLRRVALAALAAIALVAFGAPTSFAATDAGDVWAWGSNAYGQLGDGTLTAHHSPEVVTGASSVVDVEGGREHVLALTSGGTVLTWGWNRYGQVGNGSSTVAVRTPRSVLTNAASIAAGHYSSFAVLTDGSIRAWGRNDTGQLGDGTTTNRRSPVRVSGLSGITIVQVAGGRNHTIALAGDGTVLAWGSNQYGQLGDGTTADHHTPEPVPGLTDVVAVFAGRDHSLALTSAGTVWAWGYNRHGELGDGTTTNRPSPVPVTTIVSGAPVALSGIVALGAGANHSLALTGTGREFAWGWNTYGQLGDGTFTTRKRAVRVKDLTDVAAIAGGRQSSIAVTQDGSVFTWGDNRFGQLGDGTTSTTGRNLPASVPGIANVSGVGMGLDYGVAIVATG